MSMAKKSSKTDRIFVTDTLNKVGEAVTLRGWVQNIRDMGKITFIDLRDRTGLLQLVLDESVRREKLGPEYVVEVSGVVRARGERFINKKLPTGKIEVQVAAIKVISVSKEPPIEVRKDTRPINEETRLKYRYLDLRSERMRRNLILRHQVITFLRQYLNRERFVEVETPCLTKGTPEGAREFLVPSRLHKGKFYVLPQSPQQFKQLLMVAGMERYYQVARCFRDEDQRGDRQPEFTQLDIEMSFVSQEEVMALTEKMLTAMVAELFPDKHLSGSPFPRLTYAEAIKQYGSDKPDLRRDKTDANELAFAWIIDFPLFEKNQQGKISSSHHPFTMPHPDDINQLEDKPYSVRAYAYDLVLNGFEVGGGSIRIHDAALQRRVFKVLGVNDQEIEAKFGHMLEALEYGAPPHGGIAPGLDRLVMVLAAEPNIREVIAFPKTGDARDPLTGAPAEVSADQLKDVHIKLDQ